MKVCPVSSNRICINVQLGYGRCADTECQHDYQDVEPEEPDVDDLAEWHLERQLGQPCPQCGVLGACAYDIDGQPMIHIEVSSEDNET